MHKPLGREAILRKLADVEPCRHADGEIMYYPCRVVLLDGVSLDPVAVVVDPADASDDLAKFSDAGKELRDTLASIVGPASAEQAVPKLPALDSCFVSPEEVADIAESPLRLPARFVEAIHAAGEFGMGLYVAQLVFRDGLACYYAFIHGVADFLDYPEGKSGENVVNVIPLSTGSPLPAEFSGGSTQCYWMRLGENNGRRDGASPGTNRHGVEDERVPRERRQRPTTAASHGDLLARMADTG